MTIPPVEVQDYGQSLWTDNISREIINNGDLKRLVEEGGVLGLTSNPSIFQKAVGDSSDYDDVILANLDKDANTVFETLAVRDIQDAADILAPVFERTAGVDGYVSLEVSPLLANSTEETVAEAKKLWSAVDRPNLMIKIPSTPAGIPAIEEAIASGLNVNVTLIFSVKNYEQVAEAYIRGLERLQEGGGDVSKSASVASFFVSRIDVMVDNILENNIKAAQGRDLDRVSANRKLLGKAAIANAKLAYKSYQRIFEGERFASLKAAGAHVQRPLWASTGTKNPAYSDTLYVDELIGANTVNTLPPGTLTAFTDHGTVAETITKDVKEAGDALDMLAEVGVDFDDVTHRLQVDGVEKFIDSFEILISQVEAKRVALKTGIIKNQNLALGIYREGVEDTVNGLQKDHINVRIWNKDASVWKDNPAVMEKINNRLGWLDVLTTIDIDRLKALQTSIKDSEWKHVVLLGMGGSSLAPEILFKTFGQQAGFPDLRVLDSTNPAVVASVRDAVDLSKTLFIVASKSGGTIETLSFYKYFFKETGGNGAQFIAITDDGSKLQKISADNNFRDTFVNPSDIGGRYSSLSYFGMVPAALIGLDLDKFWAAARAMIESNGEIIPANQHPGIWLGSVMGHMAQEGRDKLVIVASESIASYGDWAEQLIAESTGKEGKGILPVVGGTVGMPHDHGSDCAFIYLKLAGDVRNEALDASVKAIREAGHPRVTLHIQDKYQLAGEFFRWEYATAIVGKMLNINPFDEPNVTESKNNTNELLDYYKDNGELPAIKPVMTEGSVAMYANADTMNPLRELCNQHGFNSGSLVETVAAQIAGTHAGDYFALLTYAPQSEATDETLADIRRKLRHATKRPTTVGYGPRFLHSTGQLHKGGANNGVFFQLTHADEDDIAIPDAPYSFGVLKTAQAAGDIKALDDHKRRAVRLDATDGNIQSVLDVLNQAVDFVAARRP